jgi:hypothetical protein
VEVLAHIGDIPVEEWLPFLVPIIGLYVWGRRRERRGREKVRRLPDVSELKRSRHRPCRCSMGGSQPR